MKRRRSLALLLLALAALALWLASCSPAAAPTPSSVAQTQVVSETQAGVVATQPAATAAPTQAAAPTASAPPLATAAPTATALVEARAVELEWPPQMRLGDSDIIRLAVVPIQGGYEVTTEFGEHQTITQPVTLEQPAGYDLHGIARLDAAGFDVSPAGEQAQRLLVGQTATWRWTLEPQNAGQQRVALSLRLRWTPQAGNPSPARETTLYDKALTIRVLSFMGLSTREAGLVGLLGLVFGSTLSVPMAAHVLRPRLVARPRLQFAQPNAALVIEPPAGVALAPPEMDLLKALFKPYGRLVVEAEFRSGYSGARTWLAQPIRPDGRADAYTIAKIGDRASIQQEFENYETYVKDTLPPITARIQSVPVSLGPAPRRAPAGWHDPLLDRGLAALRYTFIGEPGRSPLSLRQALLADPDPALLEKLFATFGPNWWMQRRPYTFRLGAEYDRFLPTHYVLEPLAAGARPTAVLDGRQAPSSIECRLGQEVSLRHVRVAEVRPDGRSLSLVGQPPPGQPPLRLRWLSLASPAEAAARVVGTREALLAGFVRGRPLHGLPDPFPRLPALLQETVTGTRSTIHGDLNLENVLVGPGGFVWLIDFAQTREGHPLYDFAHLEAAVIAQVISPQTESDQAFLRLLEPGAHPLLAAFQAIAQRCLFNPSQPREYQLARFMACAGALKYLNLDPDQKGRLYLAAAFIAQHL